MYQFPREKVLPIFLRRRIPVKQLAREAAVDAKTIERAVNGLPVTAVVVARIADVLGISPLDAVFVERR